MLGESLTQHCLKLKTVGKSHVNLFLDETITTYVLYILVATLTGKPVILMLFKIYNFEKLTDWLSCKPIMMHVQSYEIMYYIVWWL